MKFKQTLPPPQFPKESNPQLKRKLELIGADHHSLNIKVTNENGEFEITVLGSSLSTNAIMDNAQNDAILRLFAFPMEQLRFGNVGMASIMCDMILNGKKVQPAFLDDETILANLDAKESLEEFCKLPRSNQQNIIDEISRQMYLENLKAHQATNDSEVAIHAGNHQKLKKKRTHLIEIQNVNSSSFRLETNIGIKHGTILGCYLEGDLIESRKKLSRILGLTHIDHDNDRLFSAIITGNVIEELRLKPDYVRCEDGLVGAQAFHLSDNTFDYVKLVDMRPSQAGAINLRKAGIPSEEIKTIGREGTPLRFVSSDGIVENYGISRDIRSFRGVLKRAGISLDLETLEAHKLAHMHRSSSIMRFFYYMPINFYKEFGYFLAAQIANSSSDGHESNSWAMLLKIANPDKDIEHLTRKGYFIENKKIFMFGRIDCDDSAGSYLAKGNGLSMDFSDLEERIGGMAVLQRVFVNFTFMKNKIIKAFADRDGTTPEYVNVEQVVNEAFDGPIPQGIRLWHEDHNNLDYYLWMIENMEKRREMPIGFSIPLDPAQISELEREGIIYFGWACNGEVDFPVFFRDGRSKMFDDHERFSVHVLSDTLFDKFPNNTPIYITPSSRFRQAYPRSTFAIVNNKIDGSIKAERHGDYIRTESGFGKMTGIPTDSFGAKFAFTTLMNNGIEGMLEQVKRIKNILISREYQMEQYAQYRRHSVLDNFIRERIPEGRDYKFKF